MEEDIEIPPITRIMKLNLPEWPLLVIGSIFAAIAGGFPVAFAVIISEILKVCLSYFRHIKLRFYLHLQSSQQKAATDYLSPATSA